MSISNLNLIYSGSLERLVSTFQGFFSFIGDGPLDVDWRFCRFVSYNIWSSWNNIISDLHPDADDRVRINISSLENHSHIPGEPEENSHF